jgi:hypothetical protein
MDANKLSAEMVAQAISALRKKKLKAKAFPDEEKEGLGDEVPEETPIDDEALAALLGGEGKEEEDELEA